MAAATAEVSAESRPIAFLRVLVKGSTTIYKGTSVCVDANGYAVPGADTSGLQYVGEANNTATNSGSSGDAVYVDVQRPDSREAIVKTAASAAQAWVGDLLYLVDDQTVALAATTANDIPVGRCLQVLSTTRVMLDNSDRV